MKFGQSKNLTVPFGLNDVSMAWGSRASQTCHKQHDSGGGVGIIYFMIVEHNNAIPTLVMIANCTQLDKDKNR